jgi:NAD(P)-dependent dehydrogenase (short-subunit alcohol dehydrogenase family)
VSRAVLVTGASRGIGRAVAQAFAEQGDQIAVHYDSNDAAAQQTLASLPGAGHVLVQGDLADAAQVRSVVDGAAEQLEGLDVLVNNAGVFLAHPPTSTSWEDWQRLWSTTLAVNLTGAAHATFSAVPHLTARGGGAVVNVSSRGAFRGEPDCPAYGASKAGLNAFGQSMAVALAPLGIAVSTVAPGFVETDMAAEVLAGPGGDAVRGQSPFGPGRAAGGGCRRRASGWPPRRRGSPAGPVVDVNGASYLRT